ncbi:uncharacterized protein LOC110929240 isoform X1 [Helianthus annuus]|uniref:uncharacterized protein LOC110929240 isoform X1 n=1 Tax=Helianthus annuus TaxID=4232 RepID=UPI000B908950|nr:uncharacterized protein LOC110929240 isoform X1 [Helianthus annuus]XP_022028072.1 uncharacterized protein LOC110929240 isoform X1 [Helianthus annuus]XP_022028073.1 uncharacterized protein LOC110929240 isoform X1 [Helianthus annuus]
MVEENTRRLCFQFLSQNPRSTSAMVGDEGDSSILITGSSPAMTARVPLIDHQLFASKSMAFRGLPVWLKYVPGISFKTDNEPFKEQVLLLVLLEGLLELILGMVMVDLLLAIHTVAKVLEQSLHHSEPKRLNIIWDCFRPMEFLHTRTSRRS